MPVLKERPTFRYASEVCSPTSVHSLTPPPPPSPLIVWSTPKRAPYFSVHFEDLPHQPPPFPTFWSTPTPLELIRIQHHTIACYKMKYKLFFCKVHENSLTHDQYFIYVYF